MSRAVPVLPAVVAALGLAGCPHNKDDPFPLSVGYQPLDHCVTAPWPAGTATDPFVPGLSTAAAPACGGFENPDTFVVSNHAHGRGYIKRDIAIVYSQLQKADVVHLCVPPGPILNGAPVGCLGGSVDSYAPEAGLEGASFPVSFRILYNVQSAISVDWEHTWREGPLPATATSPLVFGARYQKTWGIANIRVQTGSIVLTQVGPAATPTLYTGVELVGWLDADQSSTPAVVTGTITNAYNALLSAALAAP